MTDTDNTAAQALVEAEDRFLAAWLAECGIELSESRMLDVRLGWSARRVWETRQEQTMLVESGGEWE